MTAVPSDIIGTTMSSKLTDGNDDNARREKKRGKEQIGPFSTHSLFSPPPPLPHFCGAHTKPTRHNQPPWRGRYTQRRKRRVLSLSLLRFFVSESAHLLFISIPVFQDPTGRGGAHIPIMVAFVFGQRFLPRVCSLVCAHDSGKGNKSMRLIYTVHSANRCTNYVHSRRKR